MQRHFAVLALSVFVLSASGCGTIINGPRQNVPMYSTPEGAEIIINGQSVGVTPAAFRLKRSKIYVVEFRREGYEDVVVVLDRKVQFLPLVGNILSPFYVGLAVDFSNGSAYYVDPGVLDVTLFPTDDLGDDDLGVVFTTPEAPVARTPRP